MRLAVAALSQLAQVRAFKLPLVVQLVGELDMVPPRTVPAQKSLVRNVCD